LKQNVILFRLDQKCFCGLQGSIGQTGPAGPPGIPGEGIQGPKVTGIGGISGGYSIPEHITVCCTVVKY